MLLKVLRGVMPDVKGAIQQNHGEDDEME